MVEQVETKSAFINKKYSNEDKLKREEEELEQLMAEQKGEVQQEEPEPENAEKNHLRNVMVIYVDTNKKKKKSYLQR